MRTGLKVVSAVILSAGVVVVLFAAFSGQLPFLSQLEPSENETPGGKSGTALPSYYLSNPTQSKITSIDYEPNFPIDRWNHTEITVDLESTPKIEHEQAVKKAASLWEDATALIENDYISESFDFKFVESNADITVSWVDTLPAKAKDALGYTNRTRTETGGNYWVIKEAEIQLLSEKDSNDLSENAMINLAVHELGHALGLNHTDNKASVMHPSLQVPAPGINHINALDLAMVREYYRERPLPDLEISSDSVLVSKHSSGDQFYLDLEVKVNNKGILSSGDTLLAVETDGKKVFDRNWDSVNFGASRKATYRNISVGSDFSNVKVTIDYNNQVQEYEEANNSVTEKV